MIRVTRVIPAFAVAIGSLTFALPAAAYIGPGLGTGAIAAVLGTLMGILMLIVGVIWYPIKRLIRRFRSRKQ